MSRAVLQPVSGGLPPHPSDALSLLQQRLLMAEEQAEELVRDLGSLGVPRAQLEGPLDGGLPRPLSPLRVRGALGGRGVGGGEVLWRQCEALVGRVCRLESLLHTLKLSTFRLETDRQLNPAHAARLEEVLSAERQEREEEQRSSRREVLRLKDQLQQAHRLREEAQEETHRLGEALELATSSKVDVAMAAEELKMVKVQMSQRLLELKEQSSRETAERLEAQQSHNALLQRVAEMERVVEEERGEVQVLHQHCHAFRVDGQVAGQQLQEKAELIQHLDEQCQQLTNQSGVKESLLAELTAELKSVRLALQKQQQENSRLIRDGADLRAAANKVQVLNDELEGQCSDLSAALRLLTVENSRLQTEYQTSIKAEQARVCQRLQEQDLLLDAARRSIQAELQGALKDRLALHRDLEALKADHAQLLQSSAIGRDTAVTQRELLERTIERLRGEVSTAATEGETIRREWEAEMGSAVTKLENERNILKTKLTDATLEAGSLSSALQKQEEENRGLMGRLAAMEHQQSSQRQVEQMLQELTDSKNKLADEKSKLQCLVQQQGEELCMERVESSRLRQRNSQVSSELNSLKSACHSLGEQVETLHKALDTARLDNRRLAQSLEQAALANRTVQEREAELCEARAEIRRLADHQLRCERDSGKASQREISELKKALDDACAKSGDLSRANRDLREKVNNLEKLLSNQKARIRDQKTQLKQQLDSRAAFTQRTKYMEAEMKSLERLADEYHRKSYEQSELQHLTSSLQRELQAERELTHTLQERCQGLEVSVKQLREERDEAEQKLRDVSLESQQISENLEEARSWFRSKFESLKAEQSRSPGKPKANRGHSSGTTKEGAQTTSAQGSSEVGIAVTAEVEQGRWASTLQRWETKRELARIANRATRARPTLTHTH